MVMLDLPIPPGFRTDAGEFEELVRKGVIARFQVRPGVVIVYLERLAAASKFTIKIVHDVDDFVTALSMAAGGYGVVLGPESMSALGFPEIVFRPLADFPEKVELAIAFRAAEPSAAVRAFIDLATPLGRRREPKRLAQRAQ